MSQTGKLMPNLDQQSTKVLNLTVLQRMDPFIEEILITAAHVTFYEFNIDNSQWGRKDVEGSLFVVKRNAQPRFQFIVMNRRNTVNGIWFYNPRECEDVANLFSRILNAYSKVPSKPIVPSNQSEFEELEAVPNISVIEGPLEPSPMTSVATEVPHESSFENFFSVRSSYFNSNQSKSTRLCVYP
ncbi:mRNA-decapping enzyme-like protein [Linum perenne]